MHTWRLAEGERSAEVPNRTSPPSVRLCPPARLAGGQQAEQTGTEQTKGRVVAAARQEQRMLQLTDSSLARNRCFKEHTSKNTSKWARGNELVAAARGVRLS